MRLKTKGLFAGLAVGAACLTVPFPAMASWDDDTIDEIYLDITSYIQAGESGGYVDVAADGDGYDVAEVEITNDPSKSDAWEDGDKPRLKVTVTSWDGYEFSSISKDDVDLSGDGGTVTSVSDHDEVVYIYITLARLNGDGGRYGGYDLDIRSLGWDEDDGTAFWEEPEDAERYEIRLYRDGDSITSVKTVYNDSYNFSDEFTKGGDYYFRVRAVYNSSNKGSWEESDVLAVDSSEAREIRRNGEGLSAYYTSDTYGSYASGGPGVAQNSSTGAWLLDSVGWWYCNPDKTYPVNQWQLINIYWYYFNEAGYMVTGWILWNNKWYYCQPSGEMLANTTTPDGYYVGADGAWIQ